MTIPFRKRLLVMSALAALPFGLEAGTIMQVSYSAPMGASSCSSTLTSGANSQTLTIDSCSGGALHGSPYVTATAMPLTVQVDGYAGQFGPDQPYSQLTILASSEFDGSFTAEGGSGSAWIDFDVRAYGANSFDASFAMPEFGVDADVGGFGSHRHYTIPVTFGEAIGYSLLVAHSQVGLAYADVMSAGVGIYNLQVVDANGVAIPGAYVAAVPEPGMLLPMAAVTLVAAFRRRRNRQALRYTFLM